MSDTASTLSAQDIAWIQKATGLLPAMDAALDIEKQKRELLSTARENIDKNVGTIKVGEDFEVETLSGFLKRKVTMASIGEDPNEEFDTGHDTGKMTGMDGKDFALLMNAQSVIATEVATLRQAQNPATKKSLFSDKEISEAIWAPLLRQKLIPENAIPDRYSEVASTFSGASGEYDTRLAAYTDQLSKFDKAIKALGVAKDFIDGCAAAAKAVTIDLGAIAEALDPAKVEAIIAGVQLTLDGITTSATAVLQEDGKLNEKSVGVICKQMQAAVPGIINAGFSSGSRNDVYLGNSIAYGVGMIFNGPIIFNKIRKGKYLDILDDLADIVQACCNTYTYDVFSTGGSDTGPGGTAVMQYNEMGAAIAGAIRTAKPLLGAVFKDGEPDTGDLLKVLQEILKGAVNAGSTVKFDKDIVTLEDKAVKLDGTDQATDNAEVDPDSPKLAMAYGIIEAEWGALRDAGADAEGFNSPEKLMKLILTKGPDALKDLNKDDPAVKAMAKFAEITAKQQKELQEAELATLDEDLAADEKNFRDMVNRSETGDSEEDVEKIEQLVMQLKKDQMILDLCLNLATLPAQAVAAFLPQAGIAVASIELVKNIRKAYLHFKAYSEWQDNVRDAKSAMSVQVEAMANRMDISRSKGIDEALSALENSAKIVAGAVSCAGPFAPAGHAVAATVAGVSAIRVILTKQWEERELREAWKLYKKARDNPDDRKTVRASIRKNPTLAKYVIAWGAEVEQDPVAKSAMQKCGLTEEVLSNRNTNVQKVVTFLETLYPDDPVLLHKVDRPEKWYPGPVEFSSASFAAFMGAAETAADPQLKRGSVSVLLTNFTRMDQQSAAYGAALKAWHAAIAAVAAHPGDPAAKVKQQKALEAVRVAVEGAWQASRSLLGVLKTFKPVAEGDKAHKEFAVYLGILVPTARQFVEKYQREMEALGNEDDEA